MPNQIVFFCRKISLRLGISILFFMVACSNHEDKNPIPPNELVPEQKEQLSYQVVHERVFLLRCVSCHGDQGGVNLESYESVIKHLSAIEQAVFSTKKMPKDSVMPSEEMLLLRAWIDLGAPREPLAPTPTPEPSPPATPSPTPLEATFASIKAVIFAQKCLTCHSQSGSAERIPLSTINDLIDSPRELVIPGNPDESGLVIAIGRQDGKRMPPPRTATPLTGEQIQIIRDWIKNGAKD